MTRTRILRAAALRMTDVGLREDGLAAGVLRDVLGVPVHRVGLVRQLRRLVHPYAPNEMESVGVPVVEVVAPAVHLEPAPAAAAAVHDRAGGQGCEVEL